MLVGLLLGAGCVRRPFFQPDARPEAARAQPLPARADSVRGVTAGRHYARHGRLYHALVGRHHRPSWAAPVTAPVLALATAVPGGLRPGKLGGGLNSISLSLRTPDGRPYVLRTLDKDPIKAIPRWLQGTFLTNALRDNISATNPYAALTVPPLAAALGVPGTRPRLFYVRPDDPVFAPDSLRRFRGQLGLLEEKLSGPAVAMPGLGPVAVVDSDDVFARLFKDGGPVLDQPALLRARLFDAWLGDWDRHAGQWNWATVPAPDGTGAARYVPVPKDRDMVYYRLDDGAVGWLVGHVLKRPWNTFAPRFTNGRGLMHNGQYLDVRGLNALSRQAFQRIARQMQQQLPDSLLERAVRRLPPAVYQLEGARTVATLRARRDALPAFADACYRRLARHVRVGGSAHADQFRITRYRDSTTVEVAARQPAGTGGLVQYRRTFYPAETRTIDLEGLGGNDVFEVTQLPRALRRHLRLRLYGGSGDDHLPPDAGRRGQRFSPDGKRPKRAWDRPPAD